MAKCRIAPPSVANVTNTLPSGASGASHARTAARRICHLEPELFVTFRSSPSAWILDVPGGALKQVSKKVRENVDTETCPMEEAIRLQRASMIRERGADAT